MRRFRYGVQGNDDALPAHCGYWSPMHSPIRNGYKDLRAWQAAMDLVELSYALARQMPAFERYGLAQQMRRSAVSVPSNIAEGHGRLHRAEFVHHLSIASGSLRELETQVLIARRLGYGKPGEIDRCLELIDGVGRMISGLIRRIRQLEAAA